jgi:glutamate racemase
MRKPIGIFDSGIGGLTVVKQLIHFLPNEDLLYFGDTARIPYGTKSEKLIKQYALEDAAFLDQFGIKLLIVACNSASAVAVDLLQMTLDIPVTGVIFPGVEAALNESKLKRIGIVGTSATINSNAYNKRIFEFDPSIKVFSQSCPLLVPLVEEGWLDDEITYLTLKKYLIPLIDVNIDTIILGCTHFPVIREAIQTVVGNNITLIDSGKEAAKLVQKILTDLKIASQEESRGTFKFFVSDDPGKFTEIGERFLGQPVISAQRVDFDTFLIEQGPKLYKPLNLYD